MDKLFYYNIWKFNPHETYKYLKHFDALLSSNYVTLIQTSLNNYICLCARPNCNIETVTKWHFTNPEFWLKGKSLY